MTLSFLASLMAAAAKTPAFAWGLLWVTFLTIGVCCLGFAGRCAHHAVSLARQPRYCLSQRSFWQEVNNTARYCKLLPDITEGLALLVCASGAITIAWTIGDLCLIEQLSFSGDALELSWIFMVSFLGIAIINRCIAELIYRRELRSIALAERQAWLEDNEVLSDEERFEIEAFNTSLEARELLDGVTDEVLSTMAEEAQHAILIAEDDRRSLETREEEFGHIRR